VGNSTTAFKFQAKGITFTVAGTSVRHLGILLSTDAHTAAENLYADILQRLNARIARWSGFRFSLLGSLLGPRGQAGAGVHVHLLSSFEEALHAYKTLPIAAPSADRKRKPRGLVGIQHDPLWGKLLLRDKRYLAS
jgi:hypothetical protein